ncbi:MAG: DegT/DnrJ/EryC1/StrS family aminotransferase [Chloroflexi bacterium]|nr:DegT/DnrJ/EryC1/StrS family aminotransferase [Chloroflexota bacterium]
MHIPMVDLKAEYKTIQEALDAAIQRVVQNAQFILGPEVEAFEEAFAAYCGARHAVGVASGTAALFLTLAALDIGPGDEVITTPFTFFATASTIVHRGAKPVFVDIDPQTYNLDPHQVEDAITPRTRAIVAVHLFGHPAEMDPLRDIAERHGLWLVEDAAQAHGAEYKGRRVGTLGDVACFSFYPAKNLGAYGDAGAVVTNSDEVAERVRRLRNHGQARRYYHVEVGYAERMDGLQGAVLRAKLPYLDQWNEARRAAAHRYNQGLAPLDLVLPYEAPHVRHVYHVYTLRTDARDQLIQRLAERGIPTAVHYPRPLHLQPAFAFLGYGEGAFPVAERMAREVFSLPMHPHLTPEQQEYIIQALREEMGR